MLLSIPLIAVDTLLLLAKKVRVEQGVIIPMIDARRMEAYTACFDSNYLKIRNTDAEIVDANSYQEINGPIHLVGDGAMKFQSILTASKFHFIQKLNFLQLMK